MKQVSFPFVYQISVYIVLVEANNSKAPPDGKNFRGRVLSNLIC